LLLRSCVYAVLISPELPKIASLICVSVGLALQKESLIKLSLFHENQAAGGGFWVVIENISLMPAIVIVACTVVE
jgi:hypothetical protein